eukprot:CAMPEP_0185569214 /NCGR_PEP_ID=MMETSP0434-20130131/1905_1 /TAXON_ID=626734 ORGANISM="Favella taraikaensis, Strain Fe Narragansett Bay" /NCGR_SAMPLE_ID=MMETSP0434 /ASSEMBLY_ACC=CAM_ASM_000379 /LENGTH=100 /DNA_ID=CAMNT_0028183927 /DNA_START=1208 /DNA_END=1513 /DNA_ORIENTATION=-
MYEQTVFNELAEHPTFGVDYNPTRPRARAPQAAAVGCSGYAGSLARTSASQAVEGDFAAPPEPEEDDDDYGGSEMIEMDEDSQEDATYDDRSSEHNNMLS